MSICNLHHLVYSLLTELKPQAGVGDSQLEEIAVPHLHRVHVSVFFACRQLFFAKLIEYHLTQEAIKACLIRSNGNIDEATVVKAWHYHCFFGCPDSLIHMNLPGYFTCSGHHVGSCSGCC